MKEPFMHCIGTRPGPEIWTDEAPLRFSTDPSRRLWLLPVTSRIQAMERGFFTRQELEANPGILRSAWENTCSCQLRTRVSDQFISIRSQKGQDIPAVPCFFAKTRASRIRSLEQSLNINLQNFAMIFITADELLLAPRQNARFTSLKKTAAGFRRSLDSLCSGSSPVLLTEIFIWDPDENLYREVTDDRGLKEGFPP